MIRLLKTIAPVAVMICMAFTTADKPGINVVFIGDSITHGTMAANQSPVVYAAEYLNQHASPRQVQVSNQGVSGRTTFDYLPASKLYTKVRQAADAFYANQQAQLVFSIMLGTNDSAIKGPTGAPVAPGTYHDNLKTIADSLINAYPTCRIVINYPIWYSNNTHNRGAAYMTEGQQRVLSYWKQIDALLNEYKKHRPQQVFKGDKKAYRYFEKNYLTDLRPENGLDGVFYLHPNKKGDMALGRYWAKAILKAVK